MYSITLFNRIVYYTTLVDICLQTDATIFVMPQMTFSLLVSHCCCWRNLR